MAARWVSSSRAAMGMPSICRLVAIVSAALAVAEAQGGGFPCADDEWIGATWHPGMPVECTSCYMCAAGQECLEFGGCVNCTAGELDRDRDPLTLCEECPEGKTSPDAATACVEHALLDSGLNTLQQLALDNPVEAWEVAVFVAVVIAGVCAWFRGALAAGCGALGCSKCSEYIALAG